MVASLILSVSWSAQFPPSELNALEDLFTATNGAEWWWRDDTYGAHWNFANGANPCIDNWQGVTCALPSQGNIYYVSVLNLSQFNLIGQLPSSIEQLIQVTYLNLEGNGLTGTVPRSIGNLEQLQYLNLASNALSERIPAEIGILPNLAALLLNNNQFTGSLPTTMVHSLS